MHDLFIIKFSQENATFLILHFAPQEMQCVKHAKDVFVNDLSSELHNSCSNLSQTSLQEEVVKSKGSRQFLELLFLHDTRWRRSTLSLS